MLRAFAYLCAIILVLGLAACNNDGPVYPGVNNQNPNPPAGNNPGGNYYQLQANIDVSKSEGNAPLPVNMNAFVKGGKAPYIYRWDVDGDGEWEYGGLGIHEIGITYGSAGLYKILLEVEDSNGQFYRTFSQVQVKPSGPFANPTAKPMVGNAPLQVQLNGSGSLDLDGYVVLYEWDFTSDGIYDYESATDPKTTTTYEQIGTYNATLRVTDDDGLQDVASVQIIAL
jgi:PKD repeat protein